MILSHSDFFDLAVSRRHSSTKTYLMYLLYILLLKNSKNIHLENKHIPIFLSAYNGKLSKCDQFILAILQFYERNDNLIDFQKYKPFVWGPETAIDYYAIKNYHPKFNDGDDDMDVDAEINEMNYKNLNQEPSLMDIMSLIDLTICENTLKYFPIWRHLNAIKQIPKIQFITSNPFYNNSTDDDKTIMYNKNIGNNSLNQYLILNKFGNIKLLDNNDNDDGDDDVDDDRSGDAKDDKHLNLLKFNEKVLNEIYDPAFLIPLMSMAFAPECYTRPLRPVQNGLLSITFAALSSYDENMRLLAGTALARYRLHLESTKFIDNKLWLHMFDTVQNGLNDLRMEMIRKKPKPIKMDDEQLREGVPRVPYVAGLFLARTINILIDPLNELYRKLSNYLLIHESFNFLIVPEYQILFHGTEPNHIQMRHFIIEIIRDGIKCTSDFSIPFNTMIIKGLLSFYNCCTTINGTQNESIHMPTKSSASVKIESNQFEEQQQEQQQIIGLCTRETNLLILTVLNTICKIPKTIKYLLQNLGFLVWLNQLIDQLKFYEFDIIDGICNILYNLLQSIELLLKSEKEQQQQSIMKYEIYLKLLNILIKLSTKLSQRIAMSAFIKYIITLEKLLNYNQMEFYQCIPTELILHLLKCFKVHRKVIDTTAKIDLNDGFLFDSDLNNIQLYGYNFCESQLNYRKRLIDSNVNPLLIDGECSLRNILINWLKYKKSDY